MNLRLSAAEIVARLGPIRARAIKELSRITAAAFEVECPPPENSSPARLLSRYALFTRQEAERALTSGASVTVLRGRLRDNAQNLAREIRRRFRLRTPRDVMSAARLLYRMIEIDLAGTPGGEIVVRRCFFCRIYSPRVCELISALDEGILAGLAGGGELRFLDRMTAGSEYCRAQFAFGAER